MNIQQAAVLRSSAEQSAWPASPPPAICGWQSPPCDAPARYLVQWSAEGSPIRATAVCKKHLRFLEMHVSTGDVREVG